jgi:uncharacterized protein YdhG (YjbR/CyaY superfamily)
MPSQARTKPAVKSTRGKTVAGYFAGAPADKRAALVKIRKTIKVTAPRATESISYGIVAFKHNGKPLIYLGYAKDHCAIYGSTGHFVAANAADLSGYDVSKGTIRFPAMKPLPSRLVAKLIKARIAEIDGVGA